MHGEDKKLEEVSVFVIGVKAVVQTEDSKVFRAPPFEDQLFIRIIGSLPGRR